MYGGQSPSDFVKKFEQPYAPLLKAGVKFQASLGNHDRPENVSYKLYNMNGQRYYSYVRNNARFLALDSTQMDPAQLAWIEMTLRNAREDWKICYFHHPLYSNADRHGSSVDLRILLEPIFIRHGVDVVFSGHDHVYERLKPQKGIHYFVSGSAGQLRKGNMSPSDQTAASFDQDQSFMLVEIAGADMFFQTIARTGKTVDSGVIHRRNPRDTAMTDDARPPRRQPRPRLARRRAPALTLRPGAPAPAARGRGDRVGLGELGSGELLPVHLCDLVRRERRRDGLLLRADDQGGGGSDRARRGASSMAARVAAGGRLHRRDGRASADLRSSRRRARRADARGRMAGAPGDRSGRQLLRLATDLPAASRDPVSPAARDRLRRPRIRGAGAVQSDTGTFISLSAFSCWLSRWALPTGCDGQGSRASGRI